MTGTDAVDQAPMGPFTWAEVCDGFHDIRIRAHRHSLQDDWRALVTEPGMPTPALLRRWQRLVDEIKRLDAGQDDWTVRHGDDALAEADEGMDSTWFDSWEPASTRFGCPGDLCRRVRTEELEPPQCLLLKRDMKPVPPAAQAVPDGER